MTRKPRQARPGRSRAGAGAKKPASPDHRIGLDGAAALPYSWKVLDDERVYHTPIFDLYRRRSGHPYHGERDFFVLDAPPWVNIIPITRAGKVLLIRQWRHGIRDFTLEIPGGMVDRDDAGLKAAARRELREETGYDSRRIVMIGHVHPNPAIQPNLCYSFLARDVRKMAGPPLDMGDEETEVVTVALSQVKQLISSGRITHALVIAAFSFLQLYNPPR